VLVNAQAKQAAQQIIDSLPDDVSFDELVYQLVFRAHVEEGLRDLDEGRTVTHEEIEREFAEWLKSDGP
jgi:predicted transcriptional regulator